ncbi:hypothetical protein FHS52_001376 [Erythromicrobium ramosum]|uniref:Uncharacterized protein n=1 Tax=Erythrobacter ramosus TaxID=35811 RepID=A0A6I4UPU7_9SPHN|nr:hypothetical protein [Erythrobacter ramosus]MXP39483.1 hypothetical protein [Erythrobacter ramosus]
MSIADLHVGDVFSMFRIMHASTFLRLSDFISAGQSLRASCTQAFLPGSGAAKAGLVMAIDAAIAPMKRAIPSVPRRFILRISFYALTSCGAIAVIGLNHQ